MVSPLGVLRRPRLSTPRPPATVAPAHPDHSTNRWLLTQPTDPSGDEPHVNATAHATPAVVGRPAVTGRLEAHGPAAYRADADQLPPHRPKRRGRVGRHDPGACRLHALAHPADRPERSAVLKHWTDVASTAVLTRGRWRGRRWWAWTRRAAPRSRPAAVPAVRPQPVWLRQLGLGPTVAQRDSWTNAPRLGPSACTSTRAPSPPRRPAPSRPRPFPEIP